MSDWKETESSKRRDGFHCAFIVCSKDNDNLESPAFYVDGRLSEEKVKKIQDIIYGHKPKEPPKEKPSE